MIIILIDWRSIANTIELISPESFSFKIKVHRHKAKTLKITAHSGFVKMKVEQLWSMKLSLKEDLLYVEEVQYLQD